MCTGHAKCSKRAREGGNGKAREGEGEQEIALWTCQQQPLRGQQARELAPHPTHHGPAPLAQVGGEHGYRRHSHADSQGVIGMEAELDPLPRAQVVGLVQRYCGHERRGRYRAVILPEKAPIRRDCRPSGIEPKRCSKEPEV